MPVEIYAPGTGTWVQAGSLPRQLQSSQGLATAVRLNNGTVLLANPGWTGAIARYAPGTGTWTLDRTSPLAFRTGVMFATLHNGRTLAAGGETVSNDGLDMLADVYMSDAKTGTWTAVAPMPLARAWGAALTLRDGRVLVLGGTTKVGATASAELYDPTTNRWSEAQPMLHAHGSGLTATLLRDGRVLVLGGGRTAGAELFDPGH
jgi:N-acetylneuraminic acid mutarotase